MNELEHLLTVLGEEAGEVIGRASKAIRFGMTEIQPGQPHDNKRRIEQELGDLLATAELLGLTIHEEDKAAKKEKLKKYMGYSRELGLLQEGSRLEYGCLKIQEQAALKERDAALLQVGVLRSAIDWICGYAAIRGIKDIEARCEEVTRCAEKRLCENKFTDKKCVLEFKHGGPCSPT